MYPTLYYFLLETFGIKLPMFQIVNTFGLFVAFGIAAAFITMQSEMRRRTLKGWLRFEKATVVTGKPIPLSDYILNGALAFVFGYKVLFLAFNSGEGFSPQEHLATTEGSWILGLGLMAVVLGYRYYSDKKQRLPQPLVEEKSIDASIHMGNITTIALITGFLGAKLFHLLEDPQNLSFKRIFTEFFTSGGWTFYGGLICGAIGVMVYCYVKKLNFLQILDSGGPAMMVSYGVGRFGCHFSGDGDWGLANLNPKPVSWLPDWAWSYTYPHNVLGTGAYPPEGMVQIPGYTGDFSYQLMVPVWPTPLYEALMGLGLFLIIWKVLRHRVNIPGNLFAWYLVFAGIERFAIEFIREHGSSVYKAGGLVFSQAQLISVILMLVGAFWLLIGGKKWGMKWGRSAGISAVE
ncbi:MAG: prolipoprotein diacylglyceryl transferase [Bacteroidia bacterium]|nr:prolipoprotein diacylglyceryl transferase [Bacteroidia bacterium]